MQEFVDFVNYACSWSSCGRGGCGRVCGIGKVERTVGLFVCWVFFKLSTQKPTN